MINITIYHGKKQSEMGYKFVFTKGACGWTAFKTEKGYLRMLDIIGGEITLNSQNIDEFGNGNSFYHIDRIVEEYSYWSKEDLPKGTIPFIALSNGSYVDCYYLKTNDKTIIYRLNPNSKNYKPYDYFYYCKQEG